MAYSDLLPYRKYVNADKDGIVDGVLVWKKGDLRYYDYSKTGMTCDQADAFFLSRSLKEKIAISSPMPPDAPAGRYYIEQACGGGNPDPTQPPVVPIYTDDDYVFQGIAFGGAPSSNPDLLDLEHAIENGRLVIKRDRKTDPGGRDRYCINSQWREGAVDGYSQDPQLPCLVQKFRIDISRPQNRWWDDPVENAMQTIRYI